MNFCDRIDNYLQNVYYKYDNNYNNNNNNNLLCHIFCEYMVRVSAYQQTFSRIDYRKAFKRKLRLSRMTAVFVRVTRCSGYSLLCLDRRCSGITVL